MAKTLQFRRGTTSELSSQTGAVGELFVDTTKDTVVVMDGSTPGGFPLQSELLSGTNIKTVNGTSLLGSGNITISGSGSTFNQELNTTDDVVFNSALIGDVSIVGNEISGTDAYGNSSELLINAPLTVNAGGTSSNTVLYTNTLTGAGNVILGGFADQLTISYAYQNVKELFTALNPGDTFTLRNNINSQLLTYTFVSLFESGSDLIINVEEYNNSSEIYFSQNYLELNYTINTLVNVLEVTETGVNVEGTFTVNGQPVSGESGSSFDQDLNTTDDVVFNSALIGDVSITGNTIAGVDSYGNASTLVVDGDLEVTAGSTTTSMVSVNGGYSSDAVAWMMATQSSGQNYITFFGANAFLVEILGNLTSGSILELYTGSNFPIEYTVDYVVQNGNQPTVYVTNPIDGGANFSFSMGLRYSTTVDTTVTVASFSENGVNVNGEFTVNGQPVSGGSGSSFDQDLNTTDDVVFNSALIGEVSIIGNEISATDAYGNDATLVVSSELQVQTGSVVTDVISRYAGAFSLSNPEYATRFSSQIDLGADSVKFVNGAIVTLTDIFFGQGTFVFQLTGDLAYDANFNEWSAPYNLISGTMSGASVGSSSVTFTSGNTTIPLSVTSAGVNVNGTFTVNGQPVSGGSGSSFDQDLNTTDDVVFNSALIGNISVIDNTIASTDSYGLPTTLNVSAPIVQFDSNVNLSVNTFVETIDTVTDATNTSQFTVGSTMMSGGNFTYSPFNGSSWADASKFISGSLISVNDPMYGTIVIQLTSDFTYDNMDGRWEAPYVVITNNTGYSNTFTDFRSYSVIVTNSTGSIADYTFDDQGVFTTTSLVADSALIGDVSIIDNQIAVQDSYGLPGTLNVSASEVVINSNLNLAIDSRESTTETVTDAGTTNQFTARGSMSGGGALFTYSPNEGSSWADASKFMTGSQVTITDSMYGTVVIELTSDFTYDNMDMRWESSYVFVTNNTGYGSSTDFRSYSVIVTNSSGSLANYSFDDQGIFTAPTVSTDNLLVDGTPAGLLTINQDGSQSVVVDTLNEVVETINAGPGESFNIAGSPGTPRLYYQQMGGSLPFDETKFKVGTVVSLTSMMSSTVVIELTAPLAYNSMNNSYESTNYTLISGDVGGGVDSSAVTITNMVGGTAIYDFTETGFIADSALIGEISIVGNEIGVQDSYGLPGTLNVVASAVEFDSNLDLQINTLVETTENISGGPYQFTIDGMQPQYFYHTSVDGSSWAGASKFVNGTQVTLVDNMYGTVVIELTSDFAYSTFRAGQWASTYTLISGSFAGSASSYSVTITNSTGSTVDYNFDDQGTFTTTSVIADSALIGDVSIIGNQIAVQDSYGLPGTLNVVASELEFNSSVTLAIDGLVQTTETISGDGGQFRLNYNTTPQLLDFPTPNPTIPFDPNKFVTGTQVTLTDPSFGTFVVELTENLYLGPSRWQAQFTFITGAAAFDRDMYASSVIVNNESGSVVNYDFDDQGTFTAPTVSTNELLINGSPPGFLITNQDGSKSIISGESVVTTNTVNASGYSPQWYYVGSSPPENYLMIQFGISSQIVDVFTNGTVVTAWNDGAGMKGSTEYTLTLTSDMVYNPSYGTYTATVAETPPNSMGVNLYPGELIATLTVGSEASYNFDDEGAFTAPTVSTNELSSVSVNSSGNKEIIIVTHNGVDARLTDSTGNVSYQNSFTSRTNTTRSIFEQAVGESNYSFSASSYDNVLGAKTLDDTPKYLNSDLLQYPNGSTSAITTGNSMVNGELRRIKINVCAATQPTTTFTGLKTWEIVAVAYRVDNTITIIEESKTSTDAGTTTGWDVVIANESGEASIGIKVTGQASTSIHWSARWEQIGEVITL
jgi:hypothetical protein